MDSEEQAEPEETIKKEKIKIEDEKNFVKKSPSFDEINENKKSKDNIPNIENKKEKYDKKSDSPPITFDEFCSLSYEEFGVNCNKFISKFLSNNIYICSLKIFSKNKFNLEIKVQKKLSDFERLYKLINSTYSKEIFETFPSFSFITKGEEYMNYFDNLLNTIVRAAKDNKEMKFFFLLFIYDFFIAEKSKEIISPIPEEIIKNMFSKDHSTVLKTPKKEKKYQSKSSNESLSGNNKSENRKKDNNEDDIFIIDNKWEDVTIQLTDNIQFNGYIKIVSHCLFINRRKPFKIEEDFDFVVPLYKINVDITRIKYNDDEQKSILFTKTISSQEIYDLFYSEIPIYNIQLSEIKTEIAFSLYHNFSKYKINIIFKKNKTLSQVKNFIEFIENSSFYYDLPSSRYFKSIDEKYAHIYGLLYLKIGSLQIIDFSGECFIKVTNLPYTFYTSKLTNPDNILNNIYHFDQHFILPIHNRFGKLKFEIYQDVFKGVLIKSKEKEVTYEATIEITKLLNEFNKREIKLHLSFNSSERIQFQKKKKSILEEDDEENNKNHPNLFITLKDYTNPFVLLEKQRNKNILEDVEAGDYNLGIKILLKRLRKMFYLFDQLNLLYMSIFQFKYPIFSLLCMIYIFGNLYFIQTKYIFNFLISLLIILLTSQSQIYKIYLESYVNKYIFSYKNPYDLKSKIIITRQEKEDEELTKSNYLIEKEELNIITDIIDPLTNINKYKLKYFRFLIKMTKIVGTVEKIKNLFLWTDPKLTIYFLFLLFMIYLIIFKVDFKYIIIISMSKKFFLGFFYYRNKYHNNIEIGRILLEYSVGEWRKMAKNKDNLKFQFLVENIDLSTTRVYHDQFKSIIMDIFAKHSNAILEDTIFNIINSLKDLQNEIGKCEGVLKIKKSSPLYKFVKNNNKILTREIEPEDYFYYFVQNIKSDLYILRNQEKENKSFNLIDIKGKYSSFSSDFYQKNETEEKIKEDKKEK